MAIETPPAPTTRHPPAHPRHALSQLRRDPADRPVLRLSGLFRAARGRLRLRRRRSDAHPRDDRRTRARHLALRRAAPGRRAAGARPAGRVDAARCRPTASRRRSGSTGSGSRTTPATRRCRFKDRAVAVAAARAVEFGVEALACASTGNLAGATAAAAAASGCRPTSSSRPTSSRPRSTTRWPTARPSSRSTGTYDDVNRLCLEVADETGWGFVNINLRPFYAEGSKTLAYEIAESLGWRSPDVVVAPVASGAMFTRVARGFEELAELGLIERRPIRFVGGQAAGCAPVATAWAAGTDVIEPVRTPGHDRPLAGHRQPGRRPLRGRAGQRDRRLGRGDRGRGDRGGDPRRRPARGHLPGDGRRRDPGRGRRGAASRRDPARRRGRRAADRQRPQDPGRADARACATASPGPASPGWRR